jgi:meso-butanediol dehydrogenase / (S,S)-butanediol dehydrogenase / diacetyl reductase
MAMQVTRPARLAGKIAFITGTAGGQGRAAAQLFAAEGARVIGCDLNVEGAEETVELVRGAGGEMTSFSPVDLGDHDAARAWIEQGIATAGGIDVLYNNASTATFGPVGAIDPADWAFTFRNEVDLILWTTQAAWPHLIERAGGSIINTASCAGHRGWATVPGAAHSATKGAVIALTRQLAAEGCAHGIRVNSISPGVIVTPAVRGAIGSGAVTMSVPMALGRLGRPEDIAHFALYLASDESSWVTASDFVIDGGQTGILGLEAKTVTPDLLDS